MSRKTTQHSAFGRFPAVTIAVLGLLYFSFSAAAQSTKSKGQSGEAIIEQLQKTYTEIENYEAEFVQTVAHKMFSGRLDRSYGKVFFKKGGSMHWAYERPEKKFFVYDGETLWIYEPEVPQVFKGSGDTERLRRGLAFLTGEGKILADYTAKKLDPKKFAFEQKGYVVALTPKKNSPFKTVELYIDKNTFRVVRSVVVDHEGNRNRLDFNDVKTNTKLDDALFTFIPPAGVPVIQSEK